MVQTLSAWKNWSAVSDAADCGAFARAAAPRPTAAASATEIEIDVGRARSTGPPLADDERDSGTGAKILLLTRVIADRDVDRRRRELLQELGVGLCGRLDFGDRRKHVLPGRKIGERVAAIGGR